MPDALTSLQRVQATLGFRRPDYVPLYDQYWGNFLFEWRTSRGVHRQDDAPLDDIAFDAQDIQAHFGIDMFKAIPNEDPWPSRKAPLGSRDGFVIERDGWGRVIRRKPSSPYGDPLEVPLLTKISLDGLRFESPKQGERYRAMVRMVRCARQLRRQPYVFFKIGGPFLRCSFLRGDVQWLIDIAEDPTFCRELATTVAGHLTDVAIEAVHCCGLPGEDTSVWIFDDIASNRGPLISPRSYENIFLPVIRRMVAQIRAAGIARVGYHSDGDVRPVLDGLVDAGIGVLNPIEPRANMDVVALRRRYGHRLAFVGGLCNTQILPQGTDEQVRHHVERVLSVADDGGLVIGSHSISKDISQERYELVMDILHQHGRPRPGSIS